MSDAELFELGLLNAAQAMTMLNAYLALTFGFILVSYVAGPDLTKVQVRIVSALYLIGVAPMIFGNYHFTIRSAEFEGMVSTSYPISGVTALGSASSWAIFLLLVLTGGVIGSYYFLYSTRRKINDT